MNIIGMLMGILVGACTGIQGGINAQLTKYWAKNSVLASTVSFLIGTLILWVLTIILVIPIPVFTDNILWWHWTGGFLGAYYVFALVYLSPKLGASNVVALILAGQILTAVILDHFGFVGFPVNLVTPTRLLGIVLLILGVIIIKKS